METIFSDQLVQWLNERNMSQADLAKHTKISPAEISRIMSGERKTPGLETIVLIAKALRLAPEIVFRAAAGISTPPHTEYEEQIIYQIRQLSDSDRGYLLETINILIKRGRK